MFKKRFFVLFLLLLGVVALVACGAPEIEPGAPGEEPTATPEAEQAAGEALPAAIAALADFLGIDAEAVELEKIEDAEWSDGCLGLGGPAESCLAAITPGYAITLVVDGEPYVVRTDLTGEAVRVEAAYAGEPSDEEPTPEAALAALERLAAELGLSIDEIEIESFEPAEWSDGCLGLGGPAESCLAAITPGYLVVLRAGEELYHARTDLTGDAVRFEELSGVSDERPGSVTSALEALAGELGVAPEAIEVLSFEAAEWGDSCLGLGGPAESCLQVITPGWLVMLSIDGTEYEVRTDETGNAVRIAGLGEGQPGAAVLIYERSGGIAGEMVTVNVYADGTVERTASQNAPGEPLEIYVVDPAEVEAMLAELEEVGFFELESSYVPEDPCCDLFTHLMSVRRGDDIHTVEALEGGSNMEEIPVAVWESVAIIENFVEEAGSQE